MAAIEGVTRLVSAMRADRRLGMTHCHREAQRSIGSSSAINKIAIEELFLSVDLRNRRLPRSLS